MCILYILAWLEQCTDQAVENKWRKVENSLRNPVSAVKARKQQMPWHVVHTTEIHLWNEHLHISLTNPWCGEISCHTHPQVCSDTTCKNKQKTCSDSLNTGTFAAWIVSEINETFYITNRENWIKGKNWVHTRTFYIHSGNTSKSKFFDST